MKTDVPPAEMDVLGCVYRRGEATAREIRLDLSADRPMAHGSVLTLLKRLEARGLVVRRKADVGKAFVYLPTRKQASAVRPLLKRVVNRVFGGDAVALVASLFETRPPTPSELAEIEALVRDQRRKDRR
ncbi:MAG TPA: BlaI/MecI/CopY family transcriptional regulator [Vicinamibacterales bacterium]|nr:BlaI/MecI/CopY family transcriptional regulator [Vicinamibacterales bacterium]